MHGYLLSVVSQLSPPTNNFLKWNKVLENPHHGRLHGVTSESNVLYLKVNFCFKIKMAGSLLHKSLTHFSTSTRWQNRLAVCFKHYSENSLGKTWE